MDRSQPGTEMFDFDDVARRGLLVTAESLEELAGKIGIPPESLAGEIDGYNARIRAGEPDPLGRRSLSMGYGEPLPIDEPPFHAFKATAGIVATYCGVTVDAFARLLDGDGRPIDHVYAIGEIMGGFHGRADMTGTSLGKSAVFGSYRRIACLRRSVTADQVSHLLVGGGGAGPAAAILAHDPGASVAIPEKREVAGGNTRLNAGSLPGAATKQQAERGIEDLPALLKADRGNRTGRACWRQLH